MLSVIIPTRNRDSLLEETLHSLIGQTLPPQQYEIIIVDNGSIDDTKKVINKFEKKLPGLRSFYVNKPGLHNGRHKGMLVARNNILVFADDDIEASPLWLASIQDAFQDKQVAMVGGNNYPQYKQSPPEWLINMWEQSYNGKYKAIPSLSIIEFDDETSIISPYLIWGCNFSIRKDVLLKAGAFHPDSLPKDLIRYRGDGESHVSKYVADSGLKSIFHSGASIYHKVTAERMTFEYFYQRGYNQGISDSYSQLRNDTQPIYTKSEKHDFQEKENEANHNDEVKLALSHLYKGHKEGFLYHQILYRDDPEIREWVHKSTYY